VSWDYAFEFSATIRPEEADALCSFIDLVAEEASVPPGQLSPLRSLYRDWWSDFLPALYKAYPGWSAAQSPPADNWINLPAGHSGVMYGVNFSGRAEADRRLRAELYIDPAAGVASTVFDRLQKHKDEIESSVGSPLSWERLEHRRACRVAKYSPFRAVVLEQEAWPKYREWLVHAVGSLRQAIGPHLDAAVVDQT
jgi:hypothetical protein